MYSFLHIRQCYRLRNTIYTIYFKYKEYSESDANIKRDFNYDLSHYLKSDIDQWRITGTEPSFGILSHTKQFN